MENDKPISISSEDRLNRELFVKAMVSQILTIKDTDSRVVGLYGKWGSGKTSIIQLLDEELKTKEFYTAYFNPWRYKSEDMLLKELFMKILQAVKSKLKLTNKINAFGKLLQEYSEYISLPKVSVFGIELEITDPVKGLSKGVGSLLKGNDSFDKKKEQINEVLKEISAPLIIFIDDVDRLDITEIQSLFKLVKLTADFNNLIYIIAFDEEIVSKALAKSYGSGDVLDGKNFLEKIVQLPLRIPYINNNARFEYTLSLLNDWIKNINIEIPEKYKNEFVAHFHALHNNFIHTPRDSKRLINSISFSYQCLINEICIFDIILFELFRVFLPQVFHELCSFQHHLFSNPYKETGRNIRMQQNDVGKNFKEKISSYGNAFTAIEGAIDFMFPSNDVFNVGLSSYRSENEQDLFKYQRVGMKKYFDRYLEFNIGENDITDTEFKKILAQINLQKYAAIQPEIDMLMQLPKSTILNLINYSKGQLTEVGKINTAILLCTKQKLFKRSSEESSMFYRPVELPLQLLETVNEIPKVSALKYIIEKCERVNYAATILFYSIRGFGKEKAFRFEPARELIIIIKKFTQYVHQLNIEKLFENVDEEKNDIIFSLIEDYGNISDLKSSLQKMIEDNNANLLLIMKSLIHMTYVNFSNIGEYGSEIQYGTFEFIEKYIPREICEIAALNLFPEFRVDQTLVSTDLYFKRELESDKRIIYQYLQFVKTTDSSGNQ